MNIRRMEVEDYSAVMTLWSNTPGIGLSEADSEENIQAFLRRNDGLSFVCEEEGKLVGSILTGHDGRRGYIYHLAVEENNRGWGLGRKLVRKSLDALQARGITKVHLFVFTDNVEGNRFWDLMGWEHRDELYMYSKNI